MYYDVTETPCERIHNYLLNHALLTNRVGLSEVELFRQLNKNPEASLGGVKTGSHEELRK